MAIRLKETQQVETAPAIHRLIPDPLEDVIEGKNRHERYCNFVTGVLGKIWPAKSDSGEYGDDFWRSNRYDKRLQSDVQQDEWIGGYTQFSPQGRDPLNLTAEEFETVVQNLGTADYIRVRSVPPQLLQPGITVASVGGSCALETNSMRTIADIRAHIELLSSDPEKNKTRIEQDKKLLLDFVRSSVAVAPTISHISGAMLGGYDVGVHYWETDMWKERIEKEMGISPVEAEQIVLDAYQRIHDAVQRRSTLINRDSTILKVNFDELKMDPAIQRWAMSMGLDLNDHRVIEVMHTYIGPEQLNLLKEALYERQEHGWLSEDGLPAAEAIMRTDVHVRGKQIDHLRWGSMNLPKEVIMGLRPMTDEEQSRCDNKSSNPNYDYAFDMGIKIMTDVYKRHTFGNPTSVAVGFVDIPAPGNEIQHESRDVGFIFTGQSPDDPKFLESINEQLHNPARLNRLNIDEHLAYLKNYTIDNSEPRKQLLTKMGELQQEIKPFEARLTETNKKLKKIEEQTIRYQTNIDSQTQIVNFVQLIINGGNWIDMLQGQQLAKQIRERGEKSLQHTQQKQDKGTDLNEEDLKDLHDLPDLIAAMKQIENGATPVFSEGVLLQLKGISESATKLITDLQSQLKAKVAEQELAKTEVEQKQTEFEMTADKRQELATIREALANIGVANYFPLSNNSFIHHAMQFLWDHDFLIFLKEAVAVQEKRATKEMTKEQSVEEVRQLMEKIYPKLATYINYLYGRIDYPDKIEL